MSRIGKLPISIPAGVTVTVSGNEVAVKGPKGELKQTINPIISVEINGNEVVCTRPNDEKQTKAMHGLYRVLINNMVVGVSKGYQKTLELVGVGYRVNTAVSFMAGFEWQWLRVGYSFDLNVGKLSDVAWTSHEIMLSFNIPTKKNKSEWDD